VASLYWLEQIQPRHLTSVGLKALHLGQLCQQECPVLPGFVVSAQVWQTFLETISWVNPLFADLPASSLRLNIDDAQQLQAVAHQLRTTVSAAPLPDPLLQELEVAIQRWSSSALILRPSLVVEPLPQALNQVPWYEVMVQPTGLIASQISLNRSVEFAESLKRLWSDFFSAKSLFYWQRLGVPLQRIKLAVLVQPIQSAIASGRIQPSDTDLELCATVGLGMALERGEVVPDRYVIEAKTGVVVHHQLGQRSIAYEIAPAEAARISPELSFYPLDDRQRRTPALTDAEVQTLLHLHQKVMARMGREIALEWVISKVGDHTRPFVTQVVPQSRSSVLPVTSHLPCQPRSPKGELFSGAELIATGLAAAPGQAVAPATILSDSTTPSDAIAPHTVLVTPTVPLDWLPLVQQAAALVTEQGGLTSHSAILARELGVPAVMGISHSTSPIRSGELLWVDGDRGRVYRLPRSQSTNPPPITSSTSSTVANILPHVAISSISLNAPRRTKLLVNLSQLSHLERVASLPVDGVGLLRAELLAVAAFNGQHPAQWLQQHSNAAFVERMADTIATFAKAFQPRPVFYRSFDLRAHEFASPKLPALSMYPMLGVRGTFSYQIDATLFDAELLALRQVQQMGYNNIHLLLPFVRTVEEFQFCRQRVLDAGLMHSENFQLWIMAEVPSILLLLPDYVAAGAQGISIGTNDLTQLVLGVDRDDAQLAKMFEKCHPAVERAIAQLVQTARSLNIPCSICGEAPIRHPDLIPDLIKWGIDAISVTPEALESTAAAIFQAESNLSEVGL